MSGDALIRKESGRRQAGMFFGAAEYSGDPSDWADMAEERVCREQVPSKRYRGGTPWQAPFVWRKMVDWSLRQPLATSIH